MNIIKTIRNAVLIFLGIITVNVVVAFAQDGEIPPIPIGVTFSGLFLIPLLLGNFAHWLVKWGANRQTTPAFFTYLLDNLPATIAGIFIGWGAVGTQFATNPAAFADFNTGSFMMVLMTVWAADTINSNFSKTAPPKQVQ